MGFCFAVSFYFSCNNKVSICNSVNYRYRVVVATAKVQIFKQITTCFCRGGNSSTLLLLPQRYKFSSKSQRAIRSGGWPLCCCCYRKGTNFQANHNALRFRMSAISVVVATAKVQIFKQITTGMMCLITVKPLLLLPQRYKFSSKSQQYHHLLGLQCCCCCYRKGTNFQANHNPFLRLITGNKLLLLPQRYKFSSKSQRFSLLVQR